MTSLLRFLGLLGGRGQRQEQEQQDQGRGPPEAEGMTPGGKKKGLEDASDPVPPPTMPTPMATATEEGEMEEQEDTTEEASSPPAPAPVPKEGGGKGEDSAATAEATPAVAATEGEEEKGKGKEQQEEEEGGHPPPDALDLVFAVDCTGSMASYIAAAQRNIRAIVDGIAAAEGVRVRFGLVCYRDHPPQDSSYVTRVFPFTAEVDEMKTYVDTMEAAGGGDGPEAVADALHEVAGMAWREEATKVAVLIADAPPHGLGEACDGFPNGCPSGHDPLALARQLAARGVTVYAVGCEPALSAFFAAKDFLISLAELTAGQALVLESASRLAGVILGTAQEEIALTRLQREVVAREVAALGRGHSEETYVQRVESVLRSRGARAKQLRTTFRLHADDAAAAPHARAISSSRSLHEARAHLAAAAAAAGHRPAAAMAAMGMAAAPLDRTGSSMTLGVCVDLTGTAAAAEASTSSASSFMTCDGAATPFAATAAAAAAVPHPRLGLPSRASSSPAVLARSLLARRGGAAPAERSCRAAVPCMERGNSWGSAKWLSVTAEEEEEGGGGEEESEAAVLAGEEAGPQGTEPPTLLEVAEDEVSIDQIRRLVRKARSLREGPGFSDAQEAAGPPVVTSSPTV